MPPLAYEMIEPPAGAPGATEAPTALILHGLMGSGRNWRTFAKSLAAATAEAGEPWRFALVDHVWHGRTNGELAHRATRNPPPPAAGVSAEDGGAEALHLAASAVVQAAAFIARTSPTARHPAAVIGHSLGGKIALRYLEMTAAEERAAAGGKEDRSGAAARVPSQTWSLDSCPAALSEASDPHGVQTVLRVIASLPDTFASREELYDALTASETGKTFPADLVHWLGSNLVPVNPEAGPVSPLTWTFDVTGAMALYDSYKRDDGALTTALSPPVGREVHVVRAARSHRWPEDVVSKLKAGSGGDLKYHVLPNAGHWLHVDNPVGLRDIIAPELVKLAKTLRQGR